LKYVIEWQKFANPEAGGYRSESFEAVEKAFMLIAAEPTPMSTTCGTDN
jgi:hypothetical protein